MKILSICPSIKPELFDKMKKTFYETSYEGNVLYEVCTGTVTEAINLAFNKFPSFDYYHITNDDVEYLTKGWDIILAKKNKITYGNDTLQGKNLPTFPMIDGDIVRALGWLQLPTLERYFGDNVWKFIGKSLGILEYYPEIIIKHNWNSKEWDMKQQDLDMEKVKEWLPNSYKDINKIKEVLNDPSKFVC